MNIILLLIDGARVDMVQRLPVFRELINKGSFFNTMITYAPSTIASMYATFTGIYGNRNGVNNYWAVPNFKSEECKTLASYLKDAGYWTRGDTINRMACPKQGFEKLTVHNEFKDDVLKRHLKIISETAEMEKKQKAIFSFICIIHSFTHRQQ